jgi:non-ribosomal peptide synthetase component F
MTRIMLLLAAAAMVLAACSNSTTSTPPAGGGSSSSGAAGGTSTVQVASSPQYGSILVDAQGKTLYLFEQDTIERMMEHFQTLLQSAVAAPDLEVSRLQLLSERERPRCARLRWLRGLGQEWERGLKRQRERGIVRNFVCSGSWRNRPRSVSELRSRLPWR